MSHEYFLRIEVRGVPEDATERVLDEIAPKWWSANRTGRTGEVVWVEGKDRMAGITTPETFRPSLAWKLSELLGRHVDVTVSGEDLEGRDAGRKFSHKRGPVIEMDPERIGELLSSDSDRDAPIPNLVRSLALEVQRLYFELRKANQGG